MAVIKPPYFGAAYYPEGLSDQRVDEDIRQMKETGINVVRLAEFAWSRLEPEEGTYDFGWLRRVIAKLDEASIGVILCTPSATPPVWLTQKYPDILRWRRMAGGPPTAHVCIIAPITRFISIY